MNPRVVLVCNGRFHHFDLARQLHSHGVLEHFFTSYPSFKLKGEGLPDALVTTFPWPDDAENGPGTIGSTTTMAREQSEQMVPGESGPVCRLSTSRL